MSIEDKIKNAKPSDLFSDMPKKKQRLVMTKIQRKLKRLHKKENKQ